MPSFLHRQDSASLLSLFAKLINRENNKCVCVCARLSAILKGSKRSLGSLANNVFIWKLGSEVKGLLLYPLEKRTGSHSKAVQKAVLFLHIFWQRNMTMRRGTHRQLTVAPSVADQKEDGQFTRGSLYSQVGKLSVRNHLHSAANQNSKTLLTCLSFIIF